MSINESLIEGERTGIHIVPTLLDPAIGLGIEATIAGQSPQFRFRAPFRKQARARRGSVNPDLAHVHFGFMVAAKSDDGDRPSPRPGSLQSSPAQNASGADRCFINSLGVGSIIRLPLDVGLHVGGRDQPRLMTQLGKLMPPIVSAATRFHRDNARRKLVEELQYMHGPQLLTQHCTARAVISPSWILTDPPWHEDAVGGRLQH